jgi:hypothetical protein
LLVGSILLVIVSHLTLLVLSVVFRYDFRLPNSVPRANNFFYSYVVLAELEERRVGSISGYRPSSLEEF